MPVCSFCKRNYKEPKGITVFTNDGKAVPYCSSKCIRNTKLGRDGRKVNWVKKRKDISDIRKKKEADKLAIKESEKAKE